MYNVQTTLKMTQISGLYYLIVRLTEIHAIYTLLMHPIIVFQLHPVEFSSLN